MTKYRDDRDIVGDMLTEGAKDLTYALFKAREKILRQYEDQRREKELEDRITKRVLEKISIEVLNEASPAMKDLKKQLDSLLSIG
jgi:hypothetical protein